MSHSGCSAFSIPTKSAFAFCTVSRPGIPTRTKTRRRVPRRLLLALLSLSFAFLLSTQHGDAEEAQLVRKAPGQKILVANSGHPGVVEYLTTSKGNVAPIRTLHVD